MKTPKNKYLYHQGVTLSGRIQALSKSEQTKLKKYLRTHYPKLDWNFYGLGEWGTLEANINLPDKFLIVR